MPFNPARHTLSVVQGTLYLVNSDNKAALKKPQAERKEKQMNITVKNGRKEGDVSLVMGQASAVFLLELASMEVKRQSADATGMIAGMFAVLVAEVAGALNEVKALVPDAETGEEAKGPEAPPVPDQADAITQEEVAVIEAEATGKGKRFNSQA